MTIPAREQSRSPSPSPDTALVSYEPDDNDSPAFSFSGTGAEDSPLPPSYDLGPEPQQQSASSLPQRLQPSNGGVGISPTSLVSTDYYAASSAASSPCTSVYADLSLGSDRGGNETGPFLDTDTKSRGQSPYTIPKRAIMNDDANLPHRSSSPLKRRASSMEPEGDVPNSTSSSSDIRANSGLPRAMSVDTPDYTADQNENRSPPPMHEQVKIIETLLQASKEAPLKEGETAYLVSRSWVDKALALRSDDPKRAKTDDTDVKSLGPVDNSDIIQDVIKDSSGIEFVRLKPGLGLESFELFPQDAWNLVVDWYGIKDDQKPIVRNAINEAPDAQSAPEIIYELHPPIFRIHRLWSEISPLPIEQSLKANNPGPVILVRSRKSHAHTFLRDAKTLAGIPLDRKIRLHSIASTHTLGDHTSQSSALTPPDSPQREGQVGSQGSWSCLLVDVPSFSQVRDLRMQVDMADTTINPKYNGKSSIQLQGLVTDQTLILDEAIEGWWVSTYTGQHLPKAAKSLTIKGTTSTLSSKTNSARSSPAPLGPVTRGRGQRKSVGKSLGSVGLHNLGNTCYMNSALQCVRSVEELTKYFLTDAYLTEINKTNPLGYHGKVALAYASLLKEIYDAGRGSVSPRDFKTTVGRCRSTFQGWGQQDSQEFLGFLLDGLQEDLSRIKKKPYIEKPDSTDDMINDPEAIRRMAEEVWDITRKRDDSVIADLFTGMYKSTLKCPECGKISITFDPFNNLTLPLPIEDMWVKAVRFFPLNDVPVRIEVELPKHSSIETLKQFMSTRTGVPANRLMGAEEFKDKFFKIYDDHQDISEEIQSSDIPTIHELEAIPTNWPPKGKLKKRSMLDIGTPPDPSTWEDPAYERMVVPVFHRRPHATGRSEGASPPHFVILSREEASDYDRIQRKVLAKVATFSTWKTLQKECEEGGSNQNTESDSGVTTASDVDSPGESNFAAHSVQGEEDMVDVTMKDASERLPHKPGILRRFNTKRPAFLKPDSFLAPELQNLFELSYFYDGPESSVPTGWSQIEPSRTFPKVADRIPQQLQAEEDQGSPTSIESSDNGGSGNEEDSNEGSPKIESPETRMADESSEEADVGPSRFARRPNPKFKGKKKFNKTYGKANKRREKQMRKEAHRTAVRPQPRPQPEARADGGPLIRLGEGLVVDWNEEAWETIFGGSPYGGESGSKTFIEPEVLTDPALKITQRRRQTRRSRGITLDECLDEFERAEVLSEQDMWYCPRCKEHRRASKKFDLWKTPDILVAHLKRFSSSGYRRDKLDILVDFPIEGLDLTSRVIEKEDGRNEIYDLIAVDDHYGGLGGGHYTAYARNFMDGRWYNYNDSSVSHVSDPTSVVSSAAYLLFYRRRSSGALGGARFQEIFDQFDNPDEGGEESSTEAGNDQPSSDDSYGRVSRPSLIKGSSVNTRRLDGSDDEDGGPFGGSGQSIVRRSVEMDDEYQSLGPNPVSQGWSFGDTDNGTIDNTSDLASDTVQVSSEDDQNVFGDEDVEMNSAVADGDSDAETTYKASSPNVHAAGTDIISVSAKSGVAADADSEEVAEIHVESGDKESSS
ncbi:ubiquitin carboxyl-terminal hydrolase 4/11 [Geosmithia morbida]|uniref:ubiquitinyl hydrolase 1 n=1 Tax=Geosmithia morbida TaxID=1094350 RepID=A0A9P4Z012_9HYPO|nr:ubiquitin carboxyl-terminal hydrolase 4/11 [Geosmithia morbida]KAF4124154.1 ubiquitin carboxyl-terminal hydrolase 4/11 [Geosmithia morbida]